MMKKIIALLLTMALTLCLSACSISEYLPSFGTPETVETVNPYYEVVPDELTYSEGYEPVTSAYAYDALPAESEKKLYEELLGICYDISPDRDEDTGRYAMPQIELQGYPMKESQVRTALKAMTDDHPEIFWMTGTMGFYSDDSKTVVQVYSNYSAEEVDERVNAVRAAANEFYASVPDGLSEFDREVTVHDYLLEHVAYDDNVDTINFDNNDPDVYTVYGALVNQVTVCEGYARAFQMLLNGLGVDCVGVMGQSHDQMHMWNAVRLGGSWYQADVTWDDREETYARYIYFNVTDSFILEDHTLSPLFSELSDDQINGEDGDINGSVMNIFVPVCMDSSMGWYVNKTPVLSDFDGADVKSGLLASAENREDFFVFYIDESMDYESTVLRLFADYPQYFFDYMNAVNNTLSDYSIDSSNASYFTHEKSRIVAVELHYY
ncbi:MAG: hypothetical protein IJH07_02700 [Ruminococcus sp.]|nr:hypothetical protein [Ruminococcus sp.]